MGFCDIQFAQPGLDPVTAKGWQLSLIDQARKSETCRTPVIAACFHDRATGKNGAYDKAS